MQVVSELRILGKGCVIRSLPGVVYLDSVRPRGDSDDHHDRRQSRQHPRLQRCTRAIGAEASADHSDVGKRRILSRWFTALPCHYRPAHPQTSGCGPTPRTPDVKALAPWRIPVARRESMHQHCKRVRLESSAAACPATWGSGPSRREARRSPQCVRVRFSSEPAHIWIGGTKGRSK
jgi:hypothetical protein